MPKSSVEKRAEAMLLDWLTDAEIGESMFIVLHDIDRAIQLNRKLVAMPFAGELGKTVDEAFAATVDARRRLAAFLRWIDEIAVRENRPPLGDYERKLIEE